MATSVNKFTDFVHSVEDHSRIPSKSSTLNLSDSTSEPDIIKNKKNFTVAVRIKPEFSSPASSLINLSVKQISQNSDQLRLNFQNRKYEYNSYGQNSEKKFLFDKVYQSDSQNPQIFTSLIEQKLPLLQKGVNLGIMAYGATNSGKTYTIFGKKDDESIRNSVCGLSSLTFRKVFDMYCKDYVIAFSFVQIYNENVYDLLNPQNILSPLNVLQDSEGNTNVIGLNKIEITSPEELQTLITSGNQARISCSNLQNIHSSRSHAYMQLQLRHKTSRQKTKMVIVDLAGSEKYLYTGSSTGAHLLKEGSNINKSLLSLGNCIKSLYENEQHIPYRDSKLTRLLKENLSGYAHNIMIACINKKVSNFEENLNSLNYALKAMKIQKEIVRKVQSQELSEYQCTLCHEKLPYALIKEINKHEQHRKRVKTRESQSLSVSPIAKNASELLMPFKSHSKNSAMKSGYKKFEKVVDEAFDNILSKLMNVTLSPQGLVEIFQSEKKALKADMKEQVFSPKSKNHQRLETSTNHQITVSEFDSPSEPAQSQSLVLTQRNVPQKKLKISLSKPRKHHQKTASTNTQASNQRASHSNQTAQISQYNPTKNYIKIQDSSYEQDSSSVVNSFRSNLTVDVLNDKEKILNERKRVLEETSYNQRKSSVHSASILKFKSTQNNLKTKNIENFISYNSQSNPQTKIKFKQPHPTTNTHYSPDQQIPHQVRPFEQFLINQRMLDSTSIAPRMKRDEEDLGAWKNILIKNVESPGLGEREHSEIEESFAEERVKAGDEKRENLFRAIRY